MARVELPPIHFQTVQHPDGPKVREVTAREWFAAGNRLYTAGQFREAAEHYETLIAEYPDLTFMAAVHFNAGLAYEGLEQPARACLHYRRQLQLDDVSEDARDARFRMAHCLETLGEWRAACDNSDALLHLPLTVVDRLEALVRKGHALQQLGQSAAAEAQYRQALQTYHEHSDEPRVKGHGMAAKAQFQIGQLYREQFLVIRFRLPLPRMEQDLQRKTLLFLKAQQAFLETVQLGNAHWGLAAGHQLGLLYEEFCQSLQNAEVPKELDAEALRVYRQELRRVIRPYLQRALEIYQENLEISQRLGTGNEWVRQTAESLAHVRRWLQQADDPAESPQ